MSPSVIHEIGGVSEYRLLQTFFAHNYKRSFVCFSNIILSYVIFNFLTLKRKSTKRASEREKSKSYFSISMFFEEEFNLKEASFYRFKKLSNSKTFGREVFTEKIKISTTSSMTCQGHFEPGRDSNLAKLFTKLYRGY